VAPSLQPRCQRRHHGQRLTNSDRSVFSDLLRRYGAKLNRLGLGLRGPFSSADPPLPPRPAQLGLEAVGAGYLTFELLA
jgi:hypothetical protein